MCTTSYLLWSLRLNPCFNGRYSQSTLFNNQNLRTTVLILVLMEDTLRVKAEFGTEYSCAVLILVLMEDTLRATYALLWW